MDRLEALRAMLAENPDNSFARYGLAIEYVRSGRPEEALAEYRELLERDPDYAAAYYHGGRALEQLSRFEEAREWYTRGIELTSRTGDAHAQSELQAALDLLPI